MKEASIFKSELQAAAEAEVRSAVLELMEKHIAEFFATPDIASYYQIVKDVDTSHARSVTPKLIKAWLSFLSGDNPNLLITLKEIKETDLDTPFDRSLYYSLKAMMGVLTNSSERLKYAKLSIDVLPGNDRSFYMANAKMTFGQLLAGEDQFRLAAQMFDEAYDIFHALDLDFLAAVALTNELLNRFKLGEFPGVVTKSRQMLMMSANFSGEAKGYWNILNLPLGMCYFEYNKAGLAISHLKLAQKCIDDMNLFHMHGLTELYLFKSHFIIGDQEGMCSVRDVARKKFGHMNYKRLDLFMALFDILSRNEEENCPRPDIELIEMEYLHNNSENNLIVIEALAYLKLRGMSEVITAERLASLLDYLRFVGMVSYTQLFVLLLAEFHFREGCVREAARCLEEAVFIYKEYGISASFHMMKLRSSSLLRKLDESLYQSIRASSGLNFPNGGEVCNQGLLSPREREIMALLAEGKSNDQISKALFIGIGTTKWHIHNIFSKLGVKNRVQAIEKAKHLKEI